MGLPWWLSGEESACHCRRHGLDPWVKKIPWRRKWLPTPVCLPGKSHGQRSLVGYSPWGHKRIRHNLMTKQQHFYHGAGRSIFWKSPPNTAKSPLHVISPDWFPRTPLAARKAQKQGSSTFWPSGEWALLWHRRMRELVMGRAASSVCCRSSIWSCFIAVSCFAFIICWFIAMDD